jgi:hypothetical protein
LANRSSPLGCKTFICGRRARCGETTTSECAESTVSRSVTHHHSEHYDPTRVGNLLIILNRSYKGGEIAVGCGDKEMFYDPASSKQRHFIIAR